MKEKQLKNTIALIYDFDGTLAPGNMQEYDFIPAVGKSNKEFWAIANNAAKDNDADPVLTYMQLMIRTAREKNLSLRAEAFRDCGKNVTFYEGVEQWFDTITKYGESKGMEIVHYINSSGLTEIIEGTAIASKFKKIYACKFLYDADGVAVWPGLAVNYTNKTQFIFKINKGIDSIYDSTQVNQFIEECNRPVPFKRMIYFGDGTTDIPCMRLVKSSGGHSIAVYNPKTKCSIGQLVKDGRVNFVCPADYREGKDIDIIVKKIIDKCAADYSLEIEDVTR